MILLGIGECLGSLGSAFVIDYIGTKNTCILNALMVALNGLVVASSTSSLEYNNLSFVVCFLWGIQDSISTSNAMQILGFEFETKSEPFSVFMVLQGLSMAVF